MSRNSFYVAILAVLVISVVSRSWDDQLTFRQGLPEAMRQTAARLARVPEKFGDWQAETNQPIPAEAAKVLQCAGSFVRRYINPVTGDVVDAVLIVGPPGPTSVHTPEICYSSRDFQIVGSPSKFQIRAEDKPHEELWQTVFQPTDPRRNRLRVVHAWNDGTGWQAPDHPRWVYAATPWLYKLQVSSFAVENNGDAPSGLDRFLAEFLPLLDSTQFTSPETVSP